MSFKKHKDDSYCFGGRQRSATKNNYGVITSEGIKVLIGYCSICERKISMAFSDKAIQVEGFSGFFKNLGRKGIIVSKKMAKTILKSPGRALKNTANIATAAARKNSENLLSKLPEVINCCHTGKKFHLGKVV